MPADGAAASLAPVDSAANRLHQHAYNTFILAVNCPVRSGRDSSPVVSTSCHVRYRSEQYDTLQDGAVRPLLTFDLGGCLRKPLRFGRCIDDEPSDPAESIGSGSGSGSGIGIGIGIGIEASSRKPAASRGAAESRNAHVRWAYFRRMSRRQTTPARGATGIG
ncbi:hypothetical protein CMUS01_05019 [Colletotrichum musicola]|uniref:Uncharacterized protein n=1 Tax=Colletotrichum musicola TaxID=2175873 RepID=A0A8H6KTR3_9PEZI|nr:hypothetical protein CMUS01_05019 [Colletotrichum musicola]